LKLFLAEGEKGVLLLVGSADSQGVYGLVSSLGSLFVRIVLQPFEEIAFVAFSKKMDSRATKQKRFDNEAKVFATLMRVAGILGLLVALHGPQYSQLAIRLLYGKRWADTEDASKSLGKCLSTKLCNVHLKQSLSRRVLNHGALSRVKWNE
jgi:oligosaccharide translocation protein RFT1